ncbi:membrane protein insertase YidC [Clostridium saccharobutylicum]|uniref:60 kDa inner membrane insertion protein n=1 Tax=Clostridium saccharobutylicum DSM 13864 TaxID=1345695 RepID=U5MUU8_CLOSA|nr:membrane protein insertase YidC [Clostridium saccharobutylicum]AGX44318.1 60 kDa inner membrane insertion protein [Clostridium saccharobutylicum DSM 13864]AQR91608.1 membrane protein insertase YidC [Clostridium saccharobutylicum]AQS01513.1 membrane protein insertase YidC [Clostridium saccharobutylicum]AQS11120.1 membrane protein insertase YidC [Clostridium saccharobutylicum]AQS15496.1 membrane protein insertase YidC [Clostridium saccharobutylicum]
MNIIFNIFNNSLNYFFNITGDLGIAIILLTISVKFLLVPLSFKQKLRMKEQQEVSKDLERIKEKYKNNKEKLDVETRKFYEQSAKGMIGSLTSLLQIPIFFTLYNVVSKMPMQVGSMIVPWVMNLKATDNLFIVPIIYMISVLSPNILSYMPFLRIATQSKLSKVNIIIPGIMSALITFKAPVALGIYLITSSLFSFIEEVAFRVYVRRKELYV